jgi:hypothetical protein
MVTSLIQTNLFFSNGFGPEGGGYVAAGQRLPGARRPCVG